MKQFEAVAQLFSSQDCAITQTDRFVAPPDEKKAVRGEALANQWHLTASFAPTKRNRILTIIQVQADGKKVSEIVCEGSASHSCNRLHCGDWIIEAELDTRKPASFQIFNETNGAMFSYGKSSLSVEGKSYKPARKEASVLFDKIEGKWQVQEMMDRQPQLTGSDK